MRRMVLVLVATLALGLARPIGSARAERSVVRTDPVCFTVQVPGDTSRSVVRGVRYSPERPAAGAPVVVLVHGTGGAIFDSPGYSLARVIAAAGYIVVAYDRLGQGHSPY